MGESTRVDGVGSYGGEDVGCSLEVANESPSLHHA